MKFTSPQTKKNRLKKGVILFLAGLLLMITSYVGLRVWNNFNQIFESDEKNPFFVFNLKPTALAGEKEGGRTNILLLGTGDKDWEGVDLTDTIMVVSFSTRNNEAALISIPRDFYVKIDKHGWGKINAAYVYGENSNYPGGGPALISKTVSELLDIPIHYYVKIDFTAFKEAIDAVDGIEITPRESLYDPYFPGGTVYFKGGKTYFMDGETALNYARSRKTTSDFSRAKRQQEVLIALKDKVISLRLLSNPNKAMDIIDILGDHLRTNLKPNEVKRLFEIAREASKYSIINKVIDGQDTGLVTTSLINGVSVVHPVAGVGKYEDIQKFIIKIFNDGIVSDSVTKKDVRIRIENGTSVFGAATKVKESLELLGFNVIQVGNAASSYEKTVLVNYSSDSSNQTIKELENYLGVKAVKANNTNSEIDLLIIIGNDYKRL